MPRRQGKPGVARALATIDKRYTRDLRIRGGRASGGGDPFRLPGWLPDMAARLSPAGARNSMQRRLDVAGNPEGWTPDRMLATKGLGLVVLGSLGAVIALRHPALL